MDARSALTHTKSTRFHLEFKFRTHPSFPYFSPPTAINNSAASVVGKNLPVTMEHLCWNISDLPEHRGKKFTKCDILTRSDRRRPRWRRAKMEGAAGAREGIGRGKTDRETDVLPARRRASRPHGCCCTASATATICFAFTHRRSHLLTHALSVSASFNPPPFSPLIPPSFHHLLSAIRPLS